MNQNVLKPIPVGRWASIIRSYLSNWDEEWVQMKTLDGSYQTLVEELSEECKEMEQEYRKSVEAASPPRPSGEDTLAVLAWIEQIRMMAREQVQEDLTRILMERYPTEEMLEEMETLDTFPF